MKNWGTAKLILAVRTTGITCAIPLGVVILTIVGWVINRAAGVPVPIWAVGEQK